VAGRKVHLELTLGPELELALGPELELAVPAARELLLVLEGLELVAC